ncbi:C4-dicarboxylate ABC transporter substrate-binding protein [Skermanella stibiiresistens SB22]|uniref:C4-dicarboxylate ABC transporter substrate-binding protein n=1 Tax=Skermanella stibiiresistens SB22 TaxID=1385369 RepID=W9H4T2_9PROT|nr:TRAP transporter substrate-binding protein [Skermanella stibiiresistens]EWY41064.1 C4-dicarboxylate ABC transporter substrate-binding protein [Skermanella stibiiresistens SB22]
MGTFTKSMTKSLVAGAVLAGVLGLGSVPAGAATFKLATGTPLHNPETQAAVKFAELVTERSNGDIKIDVLSGGQAGGEREIAESLQLGTMHFAVLGGIVQNFDPALMIVEWDFLFKDDEHVKRVLYGPVGEKINERLVDKMGVRNLAPLMRTPRLLTTNKPVEKLDDVKGMKIRVPEMPGRLALWEALGSKPTPMAFPEVVPALQLGTIDGQENPIGLIASAKMQEAVGNLAMTNHLPGFMMVLVAEDVWQDLSKEQQALVGQAAKDASAFNDELVKEQEKTQLAEVTAKMKVTEPDMGPWRAATADVYKKFENVEGFVDLYESIREVGASQ